MAGKLPMVVLRRILDSLPSKGKGVVLGPEMGEDAAVLEPGSELVVAHSDPITEAIGDIGWLSVHVASNDVAVTGARPMWALLTILLPEGDDPFPIIEGASRAADELGVAVVGGHTEETPGISKPIVVSTVLGLTEGRKFIRTSGAKEEDLVLMTKTAGMEGTSVLARDFRRILIERGVSEATIKESSGFLEKISVVREALAISPLVNSMHDPTEGGVIGGLVEIAVASGKDIVVGRDKVEVAPQTREICQALGMDPLKLISSGTLLATLPEESLPDAEKKLESLGIPYSVVGKVERGKGRLILKSEAGYEVYEEVPKDEIARFWERLKEIQRS